MGRIEEVQDFGGHDFVLREARLEDALPIQSLFNSIYGGKYPLEFGTDVEILKGEISDADRYMWLVAIEKESQKLAGTMMFAIDKNNRMGKAGGGLVATEFRKYGLASTLLKKGIEYLTETEKCVDCLYGTSRAVNEGPSKMMLEANFVKMGLFPNAVQIEEMEHLNLDIFLTPRAIQNRRRKPYVLAPFYEIYKIARNQLGLERAYLVTEREPLRLSKNKISFKVEKDIKKVLEKFRNYLDEDRICNNFFPFHNPNMLMSAEDGGSEFFVWYGGVGKQASLLGFRTDRVHRHNLLDSVAIALQRMGAAYVEMLVDAYNYQAQQEAFTAKYIPSAYFPAMRLAQDGLRDDYFVVSRTFQILDFTSAVVIKEVYPYLEAYMKFYNALYIEPMKLTDLSNKKPTPKKQR